MSTEIDPANRAEFEHLGLSRVRKILDRSIWAEPKMQQGFAWLDEQEHGEERRHRRLTMGISIGALILSIISLVVSILRSY